MNDSAIRYELIIIPFRARGTARQALRTLQNLANRGEVGVVTAAAIGKDLAGKTEVTAKLDRAERQSATLGALAGGLLAILAPPVGILGVAAGAAVGGMAGRKARRKSQESFTARFLSNVQKQMAGGSSALVVLSESGEADSVVEALSAFGGEAIRQPLPPEAVDFLLGEGEVAPTAPGLTEEEIARLKQLVRAGTRRTKPLFQHAFVIINPASGKDATILNTLNSVFHAASLDWDVAITKKAGDATRLARQAAVDSYDLVAIYGGDGSVMEAASGLAGSRVPLAILPGGTNNVMAVELGIPKNLFEAAALVVASPAILRDVDMGRANEHAFILRVGVGYEAVINETADREMKDRLGGFAYTLAGLKALRNPPIARYKLTIDGEVQEIKGLWCMIANSASLGAPNLNLVHDISVSDGLLDVIIVRNRDLDSLISVVSSIRGGEKLGQPLPHWQGRRILVEAQPAQSVTGDGEIWEKTPLQIEIVPQAVQILVPD